MAINPLAPTIMYAGSGGFFGGSFYKSTNGGESWFWPEYDIMDHSVLSIAIDPVQPETVYVGTSGVGGLWVSENGGASFDTTLWRVDALFDCAIDPTQPNRIYTLITYDQGGPLALTTDRGLTWRKIRISGNSSHSGHSLVINPHKTEELYVALTGSGMGVQVSSDYGDTWSPFNEGIEGVNPLVLFVDGRSNSIYLGAQPSGGELGGVFVRNLVTSAYESPPDAESSRLRCYPNPFNGSAIFAYSISYRQHVKIELWDLLGRRTQQIVNGVMEAGRHIVRIDGSGLAGGTYFLRLSEEEHEETLRILLMR